MSPFPPRSFLRTRFESRAEVRVLALNRRGRVVRPAVRSRAGSQEGGQGESGAKGKGRDAPVAQAKQERAHSQRVHAERVMPRAEVVVVKSRGWMCRPS